jgi:hypothetical protein
MVIKADFEIQDMDGQTIHYNGSVGTTPIAIPTSANKIIAEFFIENPIDNSPATETLSFSCDNGVTYTALKVGESMIWTPKGRIRQLYIKGSTASVDYKMIVNYEDI